MVLLPDVEVFDFRARWHEVEPHLDAEPVQRALDDEMRQIDPAWQRGHGPWALCVGDGWHERIYNEVERRFPDWTSGVLERLGVPSDSDELTDEEEAALDQEHDRLFTLVQPKRGTIEFYQPFGRCHWIAPWATALGRLMFPNLLWRIRESELHSLSVGSDASGARQLLDPLNFDTFDAVSLWRWSDPVDPRPPAPVL